MAFSAKLGLSAIFAIWHFSILESVLQEDLRCRRVPNTNIDNLPASLAVNRYVTLRLKFGKVERLELARKIQFSVESSHTAEGS